MSSSILTEKGQTTVPLEVRPPSMSRGGAKRLSGPCKLTEPQWFVRNEALSLFLEALGLPSDTRAGGWKEK